MASYTYREPGAQGISIHGAKIVAEYTGTLSLNKRQHWFAQAQLRGTLGNVTYDGWCSPFLITPNSTSPNGYALDVGDASPCSETGDKDWYVEARGPRRQGPDRSDDGRGRPIPAWVSVICRMARPASPGYRTDEYLYLPVGVTARTQRGFAGAR